MRFNLYSFGEHVDQVNNDFLEKVPEQVLDLATRSDNCILYVDQ